jgi:hypothetical protein
MTAQLFYVKDRPETRKVDDLAAELGRLRVATRLVEALTPDGIRLAELYDVTSYPAVVLTRDEGELVEKWQHALPLAADISYFAHQ